MKRLGSMGTFSKTTVPSLFSVLLIASTGVWAAHYDAAGCCRHDSRLVVGFAPLTCDGSLAPSQLDGEICQVVTSEGTAPDGHSEAVLAVNRFNMTGTHPVLGNLVLTLDTSRPGVHGELRSVNAGSDFPVVHTTYIHVTATASNLPGVLLRDRGGPIAFIGDPSNSWPPVNNVYTSPVDIPFERVDNGQLVATACAGTVAIHGVSSVPGISGTGLVVLVLTLLALGVFRILRGTT